MLLCLAALSSARTLAAEGPENASLEGDFGPAAPAPAAGAPPAATPTSEGADGAEAPLVADEAPAGDGRAARKKGKGGKGERGGGKGGGRPDGAGPHGIWAHIRPVALAQVWVTAYDWDTDPVADSTGVGDPEDDVGFKFKRARLGLRGEEKGLDWAVVFGVTAPYDGFDEEDGAIEIVDAHVGYEWQGVRVQVGQDEVPFSRDRLIASGEQTFQERGMIAEHIAPGRELGATISGERFGAKITLGAFNSGGDIFGDDNLGKTLLGRLEYSFGDANVYETWGGSRELSFGIGAGGFLTDDVSTSTRALGADAILRVAGLTVLVDAALAEVAPTNTTLDVPGVWETTTRRGLTAQIGYGLKGFEPAAKIALYEDSSLGGYNNMLFGVTWHGLVDDRGRDRVRIGVGYELRLEEAGIDNDTVRLWAQVRP